MKTVFSVLVYVMLLLPLAQDCYSQTCINSYVVLNTQSRVDSFPILFPGCTEVLGSLWIMSEVDDPVYNLDSLIQLISINYLFINNTKELTNLEGLNNVTDIFVMAFERNEKLESLNGLDNIETIQSISFRLNPALNDINALFRLEKMDYHLQFNNNEQLQDFHGLENLKTVGGNVYIQFNENLEGLDGLEKLDSIGGRLIVGNNPNIINLRGLDSLNIIKRSLMIIANEKLENLDGLEQLEYVGSDHGGTIFVSNNNSIKNLDGLINLKTMAGILGIWNNPQLNSIKGIENIALSGVDSYSLGYDDFILYNNPELAVCSNWLVCDIVADSDKTTLIFGNKEGCDSREAIEEQCITSTDTEIALEESSLTVFPNPNEGTFMLRGFNHRNGEITVYNLKGERIYSRHISGEDEVRLSIDQGGVYMIKFIDDDARQTSIRVVVIR